MRIRLHDAVERQHEREKEAEQDARNLCCGTGRCDGLPDGGVIDRKEDPDEEISVSAPVRWEPDRPVPAEEEKRRSHDIPGELHKDLRRDKRWPRVDSARTFSDLVYVSKIEKDDLELIRYWYAQN